MRTPLYEAHQRQNAKIVDFHGWDLPVWYGGIKAEHMATRESCGLFDTSHMGELIISGPGCLADLNELLTIEIGQLKSGEAKYTFLLNEQGGIIDDLIVYCQAPGEKYLLCVNAGNREIDAGWISEHISDKTVLEDISDATAMLALQGPEAAAILSKVVELDLNSMPSFTFSEIETDRFGHLIIPKTGYTGAGGCEIFVDAEKAEALWEALIEAGAAPCGLGARDTLRLEMGYPLHGNDISTETSPIEAGLNFALNLNKESFIGLAALRAQKAGGVKRRLVGLEMIDKGVPREEQAILLDGNEVGKITSGSLSPVLGRGIALGYIDSQIETGSEILIQVRNRQLKALVTRPPFI